MVGQPCRRTPTFTAQTIAVGLAVSLAACGGTAAKTSRDGAGSQQECCGPPARAVPEVVDGIATSHDSFDVAFINYMVPHEAVAAQLADLAADRAGLQQVKDAASAMSLAQGPRYQRMAAMAAAWGEPAPSIDPASSGSVHDHSSGSDSRDAAVTLAPLSGTAFDRQFLTTMIAHLQSGLPVASSALDNGTNPQAKLLAKELLSEHAALARQMQQALAGL